jgi:membrane protein DedA with SNARE-associated domain
MTAAPELPAVLGSLAPLLDHYGYLAVAGLIMLEDFGVPAPGETVLIAAAVYAGAGHLNIAVVVVVAIAGEKGKGRGSRCRQRCARVT